MRHPLHDGFTCLTSNCKRRSTAVSVVGDAERGAMRVEDADAVDGGQGAAVLLVALADALPPPPPGEQEQNLDVLAPILRA